MKADKGCTHRHGARDADTRGEAKVDDDCDDEEPCEPDDPDDVERSGPSAGRRAHRVRARTVSIRQMRGAHLRLEGALWPSPNVPRPRTRADCRRVPRPCPFVGCKHHLYLDVCGNGSIKFNFQDLEPDGLAETCSLDVADRGAVQLWRVGELMNMVRERVRQVEEGLLAKLRVDGRAGLALGAPGRVG